MLLDFVLVAEGFLGLALAGEVEELLFVVGGYVGEFVEDVLKHGHG